MEKEDFVKSCEKDFDNPRFGPTAQMAIRLFTGFGLSLDASTTLFKSAYQDGYIAAMERLKATADVLVGEKA